MHACNQTLRKPAHNRLIVNLLSQSAVIFLLPVIHLHMLSWNEIRHRAISFSRDNRDLTSGKSESQSFWNDFFHVFDITPATKTKKPAPA
jgi:hypothetical protein